LSGTGVAVSYSVNLAWNAPSTSTDPVTGYNVYRAPTGTSSYQLLNSQQQTQTSYVDGTVQNGQTYDYIVKSVDSANAESAPSNTTTVSIP
jgi:fibronectin type 3 domain-containing protein